jgi:hypothetical protein
VIPDDQARFLNGPVIGFLGTRNRQLRPGVSWASAVRADATGDTVSFLLPENESARVKSDMEDNGHVALTVLDPVSHESYQFKGTYLSSRPGNEHDRTLIEIQVAKVAARLNEMYTHGELFRRFMFWPGTVISFRVEDIFIQTPGPQAGKRIEFRAASS